jgi:F0F1-type ATP synthase delta subunit
MADNNRLKEAGGIIDAFEVLMGAHRGEIQSVITSASVSLLARALGRVVD